MKESTNNNFNNPLDSDKLTLRDVRILYAMKERNELLSKYTFPEQAGGDGYFRIYVKDVTQKSGRKQLSAKSLDALQEKVYQYEKCVLGNGRKTFDNVFQLVEQDKIKYIKDNVRLLSVQNTVLRDYSEYKRFFEGTEFAQMYVDEISRKDIENIIYANLAKYDLRIKGFASMKAILRGVFKKAYYEGWIEENQYERVDMKKYQSMLIADVPVNQRYHSNETVSRILDFAHDYQKRRPDYMPAYALEMQILMGARRGEVPPLEWTDINNSCIQIAKTQLTVKKSKKVEKGSYVTVPHTKTYVDRSFPISNDLSEFLERLREVHKDYYPDSKYLFPANNANGVITNNAVYNFYYRTCKKLGIEINREFRKGTHSFRRNAITDVINSSGGNIVLASKLFGNSPEVAKKNYFTGIDMNDALECLNKRKFS
jgi:integrase